MHVFTNTKVEEAETFFKDFFFFFKERDELAETISAIIFDSLVACLTFNGATQRFERRNEKRSRCKSMHRVYSAANDRRRDGDKQRYRWKRGNWMAAVVLTNDLTPVWTVAFDEIRIISVGACQCKCHTYIQLPLVTLRSTTGHSKPGTPQAPFLCPRVRFHGSIAR